MDLIIFTHQPMQLNLTEPCDLDANRTVYMLSVRLPTHQTVKHANRTDAHENSQYTDSAQEKHNLEYVPKNVGDHF